MYKTSLGLALLLFVASLSAQESIPLKISQKGYGKNHGLRVSLNGQMLELNEKGEVIFEGTVEVNGPTYGMVIEPGGRYSAFWLEAESREITLAKRKFPSSLKVDKSKSHEIYQGLRFGRHNGEMEETFKAYPNHPVSLEYLNGSFKFFGKEDSELRALYDLVSEENQPKVASLRAYLDTRDIPKVKIDSPIYDFIGANAEGETFNTKDYRGKYLLLDFAATGCGPCWTGYPKMIEEVALYDNLQVLTYNEDESIEAWKRIATSKNIDLKWPVLWNGKDKKEIFEIYQITGWPRFFLISPEGQVLDSWMGSNHVFMKESLEKFVK